MSQRSASPSPTKGEFDARVLAAKRCAQKRNWSAALDEISSAIRMNPHSATAYRTRGDIFAARGKGNDLIEAVSDYTSAISLDSTFFAAWVNRGDVKYYDLGDRDGGIGDFEAAAGLQPANAGEYRQRAAVHRILGHSAGAISDFSIAIELDPHSYLGYLGRGKLWLREGDLDRAHLDFSKACQMAKNDNSDCLFYLNHVQQLKDNKRKDDTAGGAAVGGDKQHQTPNNNNNTNNNTAEEEDYRDAYDDDHHHDLIMEEAARNRKDSGRDDSPSSSPWQQKQQGSFQTTRDDSPNRRRLGSPFSTSPGAGGGGGRHYHTYHTHHQAANPNQPTITTTLTAENNPTVVGLTQQGTGGDAGMRRTSPSPSTLGRGTSPPNARPLLAGGAFGSPAAARLLPSPTATVGVASPSSSSSFSKEDLFGHWFHLATTRSSQGEWDPALQAVNQALQLDPQCAEAYTVRGNIHAERTDFKRDPHQAIVDYTLALELNPNDLLACVNRGLARYKHIRNQRDLGLEDLRRAVYIQPRTAGEFCQRATAFKYLGDFRSAEADYNSAVDLDPAEPVIYNNRAELWVKQGNIGRAIHDLKLAVQLNPNYAAAQNNLDDLLRRAGAFTSGH
eukprot:TRINITY_DN66631_c0_g1_i1.p1 TRINITY_DN66631_c0_g1~~TRINITY_DN66631_c0_g1_i1.p1  ORF type:complete len:617 (-),score=112.60 TRINITY_DN66631_c0_g1_i1:130-1980(-)